MFVIEDEWHAEIIGEFASRADAQAELRRLAELPWNAAPNRCPCTSWRTCERRYHLIEYDTSPTPWLQISNDALLDVSSNGVAWLSKGETGPGG
ncbi:MAG: hypothetical protein ABWX67_03850 [Allosphingosinicella sp.]